MAETDAEAAKRLTNLLRKKANGANSKDCLRKCFSIILHALPEKEGVEATVERIAGDGRRAWNMPRLLENAFSKLPPKKAPMTIAEEIEEEEADVEEYFSLLIKFSEFDGEPTEPWTKPNAKNLQVSPSPLECRCYEGREALYLANTFASVHDEAIAQETSMHEICRRKGLVYELLIY